uniref:Uncharacterized protein n=1 Tax=Arundo donax TaxID=35708 RepID=A0A0A9C3D5_ARUDO
MLSDATTFILQYFLHVRQDAVTTPQPQRKLERSFHEETGTNCTLGISQQKKYIC